LIEHRKNNKQRPFYQPALDPTKKSFRSLIGGEGIPDTRSDLEHSSELRGEYESKGRTDIRKTGGEDPLTRKKEERPEKK